MSTIKQKTSFTFNKPAEVLFPLFSAEGEKQWAPGWDYENVMGGSTDLHEDYVFLTVGHHQPSEYGSGHDVQGHERHTPAQHDVPKTIWLVKRHEPENYYLQFYRVQPDDKVAIITVHCKPIEEDLTEVEVAYEYIGLSEKGNEFVSSYTAEAHEKFISHWPKALALYFEEKP